MKLPSLFWLNKRFVVLTVLIVVLTYSALVMCPAHFRRSDSSPNGLVMPAAFKLKYTGTVVDSRNFSLKMNDSRIVPHRLTNTERTASRRRINTTSPLTRRESRLSDSKVVHVLISAYFRGGSSYSADVIRSQPGTFYVFEPLFLKEKLAKGQKHSQQKFAMRIFKEFFSCDFRDLAGRFPSYFRKTNFHGVRTEIWGKTRGRLYIEHETNCRKSTVRIIKTIRFAVSFPDVSKLLDDPLLNFHLLHITRDPRGIISSQSKIKLFEPSAARLCKDMWKDLDDLSRLIQQYPTRIQTVKYEDLVGNRSVSIIVDIWKKLRGEVDIDLIKTALERQIMKNGTAEDIFGTQRADPQETADAWRKTMSPDEQKNITRECADVIRMLESGNHSKSN